MRQIDPNSRRVRFLIRGLIAGFLTLLALAADDGRADVIYLKDGFALHGKVKRERDTVTDPVSGATVQIVNASNFFIVDDHVRFVVFSHRIVEEPDPETNIRADFLEFRNPISFNRPNPLPKAARLERSTPFDANWQRKAYLVNELGKYTINQRLTALTPYYALVESTQYRWNVHYLTDELPRDVVRELLANHPDLKETSGPEIEKRLKKIRFYTQAGWLLEAEQELDKALTDLPDEKPRIERTRDNLRQTQTRAMWDEVQRAHKSGSYQFVRDFFRRLPASDVDAKLLAEVNTLKSKYEKWDEQARQARHLFDFVENCFVGPQRPTFAQASHEIRASINPDTIDRLDAFLTIGGQYERDLTAGKPVKETPEDILALAITGWALGRESAEAKIETAEQLWSSRESVLAYLRDSDSSTRRRRLEEYQKTQPLGLDELIQLIGLLPPPEPAVIPPQGTNKGVEERITQVPGSQNKQVKYLLQLPLEYHPNRAYPVLIALHWSKERPGDALVRWSQAAARNGYILASPLWGNGQDYSYGAEEHVTVTELIRDLRRHYRVDSDRVFLTGYNDGGTLAYDVGLSHPDLFAGVIPVNARPLWRASSWYWRNAQYLPFYVVCGELAGDVCSLNRRIFEFWVQRGYPSLMTIYKGRPVEFFQAEVNNAIDWMNRKKRATGFPELGRGANQGSAGEEFQTMRSGDNRFYWVSVEAISDKYLNPNFAVANATAAAVQATIREGNQIVMNTRGIKSMRVWLGRVWDAQSGAKSMIDFDKPVKVQVNRSMYGNREHKITPSLATMLEDLYQRGDRQRLFLATIDLTNLQ